VVISEQLLSRQDRIIVNSGTTSQRRFVRETQNDDDGHGGDAPIFQTRETTASSISCLVF
jgi:hypothetical protein